MGTVRTGPGGEPIQQRYSGWDDTDFSRFPGYGYQDQRTGPSVHAPNLPEKIDGDVRRGEQVWKRAACVNCHILPGDGRWAGNVGPSLAAYGELAKDPLRTFAIIYDARAFNPQTIMPPWGTAGLLSAREIGDLTAYLHSLRSMPMPSDLRDNPGLRPAPTPYFGDSSDPANNPALLLAEKAEEAWSEVAASGRSCAGCHGQDIDAVMKGVAAGYPRFSKRYGRVVSLEDLLSAHAPDSAGMDMTVGSPANLSMTMRIKISSRDHTVALDLEDPDFLAAVRRGEKTFYRRVGQRNHACADCHTEATAGGKWLGGRYAARSTIESGLTRTYPTWRTSFDEAWSLRKRMQWCMIPHGTNMLSADAVEYAELEAYMTTFDIGKQMQAPGLKD